MCAEILGEFICRANRPVHNFEASRIYSHDHRRMQPVREIVVFQLDTLHLPDLRTEELDRRTVLDSRNRASEVDLVYKRIPTRIFFGAVLVLIQAKLCTGRAGCVAHVARWSIELDAA